MTSDPNQPAKPALPKPALRAQMKTLIDSLSSLDRSAESLRICASINALPQWTQARCIMLFAPLSSEPDVSSLAHAILTQTPRTQRICLPAINWTTKTLSPVEISDWSRDLQPGPHGVHVPRPGLPAVALSEIDLVLVPGLAFTTAGHRLGRGGGFYDRFLASPSLRAVTVGVCFSCQKISDEALSTDPHDRLTRLVITGA